MSDESSQENDLIAVIEAFGDRGVRLHTLIPDELEQPNLSEKRRATLMRLIGAGIVKMGTDGRAKVDQDLARARKGSSS